MLALASALASIAAPGTLAPQSTAHRPPASDSYVTPNADRTRFPLFADGRAAPLVVNGADFLGVAREIELRQAAIEVHDGDTQPIVRLLAEEFSE